MQYNEVPGFGRRLKPEWASHAGAHPARPSPLTNRMPQSSAPQAACLQSRLMIVHGNHMQAGQPLEKRRARRHNEAKMDETRSVLRVNEHSFSSAFTEALASAAVFNRVIASALRATACAGMTGRPGFAPILRRRGLASLRLYSPLTALHQPARRRYAIPPALPHAERIRTAFGRPAFPRRSHSTPARPVKEHPPIATSTHGLERRNTVSRPSACVMKSVSSRA